MVPSAPLEGTALAEGALSNDKVARRIKSAMSTMKNAVGDIIKVVYPVPSHPLMHPEPLSIQFMSLSPTSSLLLLLCSPS
jgi:hypothetical protein